MAHPLRSPNPLNYYYMVYNQFHFFYQPQEASSAPQSSSYMVFSFSIPTLLNFLVLKYQNQENSPFETHPKTSIFCISTLLFYCLSYDYHQRLSHSSFPMITCLVHHCTVFFGYMAVACLASLLFPDSASPVLYVFYITVSGADLLCLLYQKIKTMFRRRGGGSHIQGAQGHGSFIPL